MASLLLYRGDFQPFEASLVRRGLSTLPGSVDLGTTNSGYLLYFDINAFEDSTLVRILPPGTSVYIEGTGPASVQAAWAIALAYSGRLHLCDDCYNFDLDISDVRDAAELGRLIWDSRLEGQ
jgi:hypothetical protein